MVDLRTRMSLRVVNQLHENYGDLVLVAMVPRTVSVQDMPVRGKPTVIHAPNSRGGRAYTEVALELLVGLETDAADSRERAILPLTELAATRAPMGLGETSMVSQFPSTASEPHQIETISLDEAALEEDGSGPRDIATELYQIYADDDPDLSLN
jgi:hypothetical protein